MPARFRKIKWSVTNLAFACLVSLAVADETPASAEGELLRTIVRVVARSDYLESGGKAARHEALVLKTQLSSASTQRALSPGVVVEYRLRDDGRRMLLAGGMFDFVWTRWAVAASPFYQRPFDGGAGQWLYWGNVRRRLTSRQSLGLEVYGSVDTGEPSKWLLAYSKTLSESLSVSFATGSGVDAGRDRMTRTMVIWRLGGRR